MTVLQFDICQPSGCSSLVFNDLTGAYNDPDNLTGYGLPNDDITAATASIAITLADGSSYTLAMPDFPTIDKTKEFTINATDLGYSSDEKIADQIIDITYTVTLDGGDKIIQMGQVGLYCQVKCCVNNMFTDLDVNCVDCIEVAGKAERQAWTMLQGIIFAAECGDVTTFNQTLTQLQKACKNAGCANCK